SCGCLAEGNGAGLCRAALRDRLRFRFSADRNLQPYVQPRRVYAALASEEPALERAEQLLARERLDVLRPTVVLGHPRVVVEHSVRLLEPVVELVALEDVVVGAWLVARPVLRVDGSSDGPHPAFLALDPDHDALL